VAVGSTTVAVGVGIGVARTVHPARMSVNNGIICLLMLLIIALGRDSHSMRLTSVFRGYPANAGL
jgi:hypothetical protein